MIQNGTMPIFQKKKYTYWMDIAHILSIFNLSIYTNRLKCMYADFNHIGFSLKRGYDLGYHTCCIVFRNPFTYCTMEGVLTDYGVSTVLDVAHLQLYFVFQKKRVVCPYI
jgi:hypothetical protein